MRKFLALVILLVMIVGVVAGCTSDPAKMIMGKTFVYEKEGAGGDFYITLNKGGEFDYYEGPRSSYKGHGLWCVDKDVLIITEADGECRTFRFDIQKKKIIFKADESDEFTYVNVPNGGVFKYKKK